MRRLFVALVALACVAGMARAEEDCRLQLVTSLPLTFNGTHPMVTVMANGLPLRMVVDTGAPSSVISEKAATAIGEKLRRVDAPVTFYAFGGERITHYVRLKSFQVGDMRFESASLLVLSNNMPDTMDGLLGADIIRQFDVDFDFGNGKLNLFMPHRCEGKVVYWTQDPSKIAVVPFRMSDPETDITISVVLDGEKFDAIVDTGAYGTVLDLERAKHRFRIADDSPLLKPQGEGRFSYPFKALSMEGVSVANPDIDLIARDASQFNDLEVLIGMTVLRKLHVFVAYKERRLYVTAANAN